MVFDIINLKNNYIKLKLLLFNTHFPKIIYAKHIHFTILLATTKVYLELTFDAIYIIKQGTLQHVFHNVKTREEGRGYYGKILINLHCANMLILDV